MNQQIWEQALLALLLWREARGEAFETKRVVAWSVKNRVSHPSWWGGDWSSVMTKRDQYSSMTFTGDPNTTKWPQPIDTSWIACMDVAAEVYSVNGPDMALGSTHYFDKSLDANPPAWASSMTHVLDSGNFHFYKV